MWNNKETVDLLKSELTIGIKIAAYSTTCSRYGNIVGTFEGFDDIGGYTMAKVHYPPIKDYEQYTQRGSRTDGQTWEYNPFSIFKEPFDAKLPVNGIFVVKDQTLDAGTILGIAAPSASYQT